MARFNRKEYEGILVDARISRDQIPKIVDGLEKLVNAGYSTRDLKTTVNKIINSKNTQEEFISDPIAFVEGKIIFKKPEWG